MALDESYCWRLTGADFASPMQPKVTAASAIVELFLTIEKRLFIEFGESVVGGSSTESVDDWALHETGNTIRNRATKNDLNRCTTRI